MYVLGRRSNERKCDRLTWCGKCIEYEMIISIFVIVLIDTILCLFMSMDWFNIEN